MRPRYSIELAAAHHVHAIPAIEQAAAAMFSEADLPPEIRFLVTDNETLVEAQREQRLWVALNEENDLVGFALARILGSFVHLEEMDVHPAHGRQGIGSRLLNAVISWAEYRDFRGVTLITFRHLPWNAPFYERNGFTLLDAEDTSEGLRALIRGEVQAGIEPRKRVAMKYRIESNTKSASRA